MSFSKALWGSVHNYLSEWVSAISKFISWQEQVNFQWDDDEGRFVLDKHDSFDFHNASSLRQQSAPGNAAPLGHIYLIPSKTDFVLTS